MKGKEINDQGWRTKKMEDYPLSVLHLPKLSFAKLPPDDVALEVETFHWQYRKYILNNLRIFMES